MSAASGAAPHVCSSSPPGAAHPEMLCLWQALDPCSNHWPHRSAAAGCAVGQPAWPQGLEPSPLTSPSHTPGTPPTAHSVHQPTARGHLVQNGSLQLAQVPFARSGRSMHSWQRAVLAARGLLHTRQARSAHCRQLVLPVRGFLTRPKEPKHFSHTPRVQEQTSLRARHGGAQAGEDVSRAAGPAGPGLACTEAAS